MKKLVSILFSLFLLFSLSACVSINIDNGTKEEAKEIEESDSDNETEIVENPVEDKISLDPTLTYFAQINVKNYGIIEVCLNQKEAPLTVDNFVKLANEGFYNGLTFHRIIDGFMIQGGNPNGDGSGGSEENIVGEFNSNGYVNNIKHLRGTISMARSRMPNSASSQFFIVHQDSPHLDGEYAAFGSVVQGIEIVDAIVKDSNPIDDNGTIPLEQQPIIESIQIYTTE